MVASFDIGNSNIHLGLYRDGRLIKWSMTPLHTCSVEHSLTGLLARKNIRGAAIASVVPKVTIEVKRYLKRQYRVVPVIITAQLNTPLKFSYRCPATLGADRIANAVGGVLRYKKNLLIISFGTATTIDVVLKDGHYLGGIINPGIDLLLAGLVENTALLKKVKLHKPRKYIGKTTEECIQSGVINGSITMVQGLIKAIKHEVRRKLLCIATGGWGQRMTKYIEEIDCFDQDLTTFGILKIFENNV